jgi:NAD(P)-dependent dehydrogenase (short-subunit alcohol dehydrogenase family)
MSASNERAAIVAGAGGELGRATVEKPAAAGFTTVGVDRSEEGLSSCRTASGATADPAEPARALKRRRPDRRRGRPAARDLGERRRADADRQCQEQPVPDAGTARSRRRAGAMLDIIVYLVSDAAASVSSALVLACGA